MERENVIAKKSYDFAIRVVKLYKHLSLEKREFVLSKQVLKSGTSVGANVEEAIGAVSKKDFKAKMSIAYKEARETDYWLRLLHDTEYIEANAFNSIRENCSEILKILYSIVKSSK
jgi:four helix bundle protein